MPSRMFLDYFPCGRRYFPSRRDHPPGNPVNLVIRWIMNAFVERLLTLNYKLSCLCLVNISFFNLDARIHPAIIGTDELVKLNIVAKLRCPACELNIFQPMRALRTERIERRNNDLLGYLI